MFFSPKKVSETTLASVLRRFVGAGSGSETVTVGGCTAVAFVVVVEVLVVRFWVRSLLVSAFSVAVARRTTADITCPREGTDL